MEEILKRYKKAKTTVFAEVPLLFECGFEKHFDQVIVVVRDRKARIESVKRRSNLSEEQIVARMNAQFDYDNSDLSDYIVIKNDGTETDLEQKVLDIAKEF
jgi:dephospho-CoA kinase